MKRANKGRAVSLVQVCIGLITPLVLTASVLAAAPQPTLQRAPSPLAGFGLMFLLTVIVVAISFMPSKRSHQD